MSDPKKTVGKIRRQRVVVLLEDGREFIHGVCDMALPTPDGKFFLVRDLSFGEGRDEAVDVFHNADSVRRVTITSKRYDVLADGTRIEEALDTELPVGVLIPVDRDPSKEKP